MRLLLAVIVVVAAVGIAEQYNMRIAWLLALATVFAILFSYPNAGSEIQQLLRGEFGA